MLLLLLLLYYYQTAQYAAQYFCTNRDVQVLHLYDLEIFCSIINVNFDQFNATSSINFFTIKTVLTPNFLTVDCYIRLLRCNNLILFCF